MTMMTAIMLTTLTLTIALVPRIYWTFIKHEGTCLEQGKTQELHLKRGCVLLHLRFSLAALVLIWVALSFPGVEVPKPLAAAISVYAASALLLVVLESLLARRIDGLFASVPVRVSVRIQDKG
jgi:hypothetical protein